MYGHITVSSDTRVISWWCSGLHWLPSAGCCTFCKKFLNARSKTAAQERQKEAFYSIQKANPKERKASGGNGTLMGRDDGTESDIIPIRGDKSDCIAMKQLQWRLPKSQSRITSLQDSKGWHGIHKLPMPIEKPIFRNRSKTPMAVVVAALKWLWGVLRERFGHLSEF